MNRDYDFDETAPEPVLYGAAGLSALAGAALLRRSRGFRPGRSAIGYAAGGFLLGAGAVVLALLELPRYKRETDEPSTVSKILSRIPLRVKLATVAGAVKGGGGAALRAASHKLSRPVRESRPRRSRSFDRL